MELIKTSFPSDPAAGPALARILLDQVAAGRRGATLRVARTGRAVAFGRRDTVSPGYGKAAGVARALGYPGIERLSGGRATAYAGETLVLGVTLPDRDPARRTTERFEWVAGTVRSGLDGLGLDLSIGRLPGEYCPGEHSIILEGRVKVAGLGQRMIPGAAHVGVVLTVSGGGELREVLIPVYEALDLDWDPATAGGLADQGEDLVLGVVEAALIDSFRREVEVREGELDEETVAEAGRQAVAYRSPEGPADDPGPGDGE